MELLIYLLAGFGITTIVTKSKIFEPLRDWLDTGSNRLSKNFWGFLIVCPMCIGFWCGVIQSILLYSPTLTVYFQSNTTVDIFYIINRFTTLVFDGALLGGISWSIHEYIALLQKKYEFFDTKDLYYQLQWSKMEEEKKEKNKKEV